MIQSQFHILLIVVAFSQSLYSQKSDIGLSLGYGTSDLHSDGFLSLLVGGNPHYFDIGLEYFYTPYGSIISLTPGIHYTFSRNKQARLHFKLDGTETLDCHLR